MKKIKKSGKNFKNKIEKHDKNKISIEKESGKIYFEITDSIGILRTYDVAEGVAAMMMCSYKIDDTYWNIKVTEKDKIEIISSKALYWLTGGNTEWLNNKNYKLDWFDSSVIFKKKYSNKITRIIRKSNTLRDIKENFEKNFNLSILYEFALKNDMI